MTNSLISINPNVRSGKPCIRTLRITVYDILNMLASGMSYDEVLEDYPKLTLNDIFASHGTRYGKGFGHKSKNYGRDRLLPCGE